MSCEVLWWVGEPAIRMVIKKALGDRMPVTIERMADGHSTIVYRLRRGEEAFYLRVLPEVGDSFVPEAYVHTLLCRHAIHVPEVIYVEHRNEALQRSVMVTTEIQGRPICYLPIEATRIFMEAGQELAIINSIPVKGFGWIKRDTDCVVQLEGEQSSNRAFLLEDLDQYLAVLGEHMLSDGEVQTIYDLIQVHSAWIEGTQTHLAHGDFDLTHIYQKGGTYTGIIDFGEIRGTGPYYDLGHFRLHDGEVTSYHALPYLLAGYQQVSPLPTGYEPRIAFLSLLIGIRFLARGLHKLAKPVRFHACASIRRDIELLRYAT